MNLFRQFSNGSLLICRVKFCKLTSLFNCATSILAEATSSVASTVGTALLIYTMHILADRPYTNGRAYATVLCLSVVCDVCVVAKRCVLEQKLLLTAYRKSYRLDQNE